MDLFLQFLASGLTRGSIYALVAAGFAIIYNASNVINFAQGVFVMLGGMLVAFFAVTTGFLPLWLAVPLAILVTALIGLVLYRCAIEPTRKAGIATIIIIIIITVGASILLRGIVEVALGKQDFVLPAFSGATTVKLLGAAIDGQSLWVLGATVVVVLASVAGSLFALSERFITTGEAGFLRSVELVTMIVLGGLASTYGAIVGAAILTALPQLIAQLHDYKHVILGLVLIAVMALMPRGLVPTLSGLLPRRSRP